MLSCRGEAPSTMRLASHSATLHPQIDMRMLRERPDFQQRFGVPPPGGELVETEPEWQRAKREREAAGTVEQQQQQQQD